MLQLGAPVFAGFSEEGGGWFILRYRNRRIYLHIWALLPIARACAESLEILRPVSEDVCSVTAAQAPWILRRGGYADHIA